MKKLFMCQHRRLMPAAVLFVVVTPSICVAAGGKVTVSEKLVDAAYSAPMNEPTVVPGWLELPI